MVLELANAPSGMTFGQLLRGDSIEVKKDICLMLTSGATRKRVGMVFVNIQEHGRCFLKLARLKVYGSVTHALMDSGAIHNFI